MHNGRPPSSRSRSPLNVCSAHNGRWCVCVLCARPLAGAAQCLAHVAQAPRNNCTNACVFCPPPARQHSNCGPPPTTSQILRAPLSPAELEGAAKVTTAHRGPKPNFRPASGRPARLSRLPLSLSCAHNPSKPRQAASQPGRQTDSLGRAVWRTNLHKRAGLDCNLRARASWPNLHLRAPAPRARTNFLVGARHYGASEAAGGPAGRPAGRPAKATKLRPARLVCSGSKLRSRREPAALLHAAFAKAEAPGKRKCKCKGLRLGQRQAQWRAKAMAARFSCALGRQNKQSPAHRFYRAAAHFIVSQLRVK